MEYVTNPADSTARNTCENPSDVPITTEADCEAAAAAKGYTWKGVTAAADGSEHPPGCLVWTGSGATDAYFNPLLTSTYKEYRHLVICERGTSACTDRRLDVGVGLERCAVEFGEFGSLVWRRNRELKELASWRVWRVTGIGALEWLAS